MKRFFKILGWICLGIILQFKFNVLYGIVFLENLNFHDRTYLVKMSLPPAEGDFRVLHIEATVHHSLGSDYFANVYIPNGYKVINKSPYLGTKATPGYSAYHMNMKRRYRDVLSTEDLIIAPENPEKALPSTPILVHFENLKQLLHADESYLLSTHKKNTRLEGPEMAKATYPQKWGM